MSGRVYLVGAGPGDPGLLTLRGQRCLAAADVVVHDDLVSRRLLEHARPDAEIVAVGGAHGDPARLGQDAIEALLVARARIPPLRPFRRRPSKVSQWTACVNGRSRARSVRRAPRGSRSA